MINASAGSNELTFADGRTTNQLRVGMIVFGTNIPTNATITSIKNSTTFVISAPVTVALTSSSVIFRHVIRTIFSSEEENHTFVRQFTLTDGSTTITGGSTIYLKEGMRVSGTGIQPGSVIIAVNANGTDFTLSTTATASGIQTLTFAPPFSATILTQTLEAGDWFIVTNQTGAGIAGNPFIFTVAPVNNTYELMKGASSSTAGAPGLVPGPDKGQHNQFFRGDCTWQAANNYVHPNHSGDVTSTGDGATVIGAGKVLTDMIANNAVTTDKIINDAVTFAKLQDSAAAGLSVIGRSTSGASAFAEITGSDGQVLRRSGTTLGFGTIVSAGIADNAIIASKINADAVETAKIKDGAVTFSKLPQSSGNASIIGSSVNSVGTYGEIAATDPNLVLVSADQGGGITSLGFGQVNAGGIADGAISNAKLANTTGFTLKGRSSAGDGAVANLAPEAVRAMSNLAPTLFGITLLDPSTSEPLNTPIVKLTGMADGSGIPTGTIWYDTTPS